MAVNGIEIEVGQKWVCRDGEVCEVISNDFGAEFCWELSNSKWVDNNGSYFGSTSHHDCDLISLHSIVDSVVEEFEKKHSHYHKDVSHLESIDVYRVLDLFEVTDPCIQHAIKKLICAGKRGVKDIEKDYREAIDSVNRALQMIEEDSNAKKD